MHILDDIVSYWLYRASNHKNEKANFIKPFYFPWVDNFESFIHFKQVFLLDSFEIWTVRFRWSDRYASDKGQFLWSKGLIRGNKYHNAHEKTQITSIETNLFAWFCFI